jgi:hypothetical protein
MTIRNVLLVFVACLGLAVSGCGSDPMTPPNDCQEGASEACACSNGDSGSQTCHDGAWSACTCSPTPPPSDCQNGAQQSCSCSGGGQGSETCSNGVWSSCQCQSMPTGPAVGDPCGGDEDCAGGAKRMFCVFENESDTQGICTVTCGAWTDCTQDKVGKPFWQCCDLANGTAACEPNTVMCTTR